MKKVCITAITGIRVDGAVIAPGSSVEVDETVAISLKKLGVAKNMDTNVIEAEVIENDDEDADAAIKAALAEIVSDEQKEALQAAGFNTVEDFKAATKATLVKVPGVGDATADKILAIFKA